MRTPDYVDELLFFAEELALDILDHIAAARRSTVRVETKTHAADYVTSVDESVEELVRAAVSAAYPSHRVVGEELGVLGADDAPVTWYVDPIDGTTNFVFGLPWSSFSLAGFDEHGPLIGVVADVFRREVFSAARGRGSRLDGRPLRCWQGATLRGAVVLTELVGHRSWPGMEQMLARLADELCTARVMGSSALSLACVGAGRAAAAVLGAYSPWDVAGILIAREAGASVLGGNGEAEAPAFDGTNHGGIAVAAPGVAEAIHAVWRGGRDDR